MRKKPARIDSARTAQPLRILNSSQAADRRGTSLRQLYYDIKRGEVPPPQKFGNANFWHEDQIAPARKPSK